MRQIRELVAKLAGPDWLKHPAWARQGVTRIKLGQDTVLGVRGKVADCLEETWREDE